MFSHVWSSARFKQWRATMISIEGLLEDEQGLSMGGDVDGEIPST
jgi:hypothetical protein